MSVNTISMKFPTFTEKQQTLTSLTTFLLFAWWWAGCWMGDLFAVTYEHSFFAPDEILMHWLWQQPFGALWIIGRALLTLHRWPLLGGLVVAILLTLGSWLIGYCLRLPRRWRWAQFLPAGFWMTWVAWSGLNVYFQYEPGRFHGALFLVIFVCAIDAFIIWTFKGRHSHKAHVSHKSYALLTSLATILLCLLLPLSITHFRHPYLRPFTRMTVQMQRQDWQGMTETALDHASLSYRPLAACYAIGLVHTGHLADALFKIRLEYDSLYLVNRSGSPDIGTELYLIDCDYHAGLFRPAIHKAMEHLTMNGPTLYNLKHLIRLALLDGHWALARKYLHVLGKAPFERAFIQKYEPMVGHPELVAADAEFAIVKKTEPIHDSFEGQYQEPIFLGYPVALTEGRSVEALQQSLMACLYSKRMPDFLFRCQPLVGSLPPSSIAEGLVTQSIKNPNILNAFPSLQMEVQRYQVFLRTVQPYMRDRSSAPAELFDQYQGYYPYYYFFGNLRATRKSSDTEVSHKAGVN